GGRTALGAGGAVRRFGDRGGRCPSRGHRPAPVNGSLLASPPATTASTNAPMAAAVVRSVAASTTALPRAYAAGTATPAWIPCAASRERNSSGETAIGRTNSSKYGAWTLGASPALSRA